MSRFALRIEPDLDKQARKVKPKRQSLNSFINEAIEEKLKKLPNEIKINTK